jgi:cell shape-determining protein MreC
MRTTFRQRSNAGIQYRKRLALIVAVLVFGIVVFYVFRSPILSAVTPVFKAENAVSRGLSNLFGFFRSKDALINENRILKERLASYDALQSSYRTLESARDDLLSRFGRAPLGEALAAGVLAHPPETPYDILIIDAGLLDGVETGARVTLPEGGALGIVLESLDREAKVVLYSGSGVETPARLERGNVAIVLLGEGGGAMSLSLPRDVAVEVGDKILLPGIRAELIAVVVDVELEPTDSRKKVLARGVRNIRDIRFVSVR